MKRITIAFTSLLLISGICIFSYFSIELMAAVRGEDVVFIKPYDNLEPYPSENICQEFPGISPLYENFGVVSKCYLGYTGEFDRETYRTPTVNVYVYQYESQDFILNDLLVKFTSRKNRDLSENIKSQAGHNKIIKYLEDGKTIDDLYWISGDKLIWFSVRHAAIPDQMIEDYTRRFPPSVTISSQELSIDRVLESQLEKKFFMWDKFDSYRTERKIKSEKPMAFVSMLGQCGVEMDLRCQKGITGESGAVDCPVSTIMDDNERNAEWLKLKNEAAQKDIVPENINWNRVESGKCEKKDHELRSKMIQLLNMNEEDLMKIPNEYLDRQ